FGATRIWHDAVRAAIVTAALHGDPRFHAIEALWFEILVMLLEVEAGLDRTLALTRSLDQHGKRAIAVRPDDEADVLGFLEQLRSKTLRHATRNTHDRRRLHVPLQLTQPADHALLGMIANRAGVHENHVCALGSVDRDIAMRRELAEHQLGVAHVHL